MRDELEQKLQDTFPFMSEENEPIYCDCGDGWFRLIFDLCQEITDRYIKEGIPVNIAVEQVKEKYGTLCFYYSHTAAVTNNIFQDIENIVEKYEELSGTICECCGNKGTVRTDLGYYRVLCDNCYHKYQ